MHWAIARCVSSTSVLMGEMAFTKTDIYPHRGISITNIAAQQQRHQLLKFYFSNQKSFLLPSKFSCFLQFLVHSLALRLLYVVRSRIIRMNCVQQKSRTDERERERKDKASFTEPPLIIMAMSMQNSGTQKHTKSIL